MKVVLDTNIWVSGLLLPESIAGEVVLACQQTKIKVVISQPILDEIRKVLTYPKIQKRLQWDEEKIEQYLVLLTFFTEVVEINPANNPIQVERDPKDSSILFTLLASHADYLVTGDKDLLSLRQTYPIITLAEYYKLIEKI